MTQEQQTALVLALVGGAVLLFLVMGQHPPAGPLVVQPVYSANGHAAPAAAQSYYQNEEITEIQRDAGGRISRLVVHRDAKVA